MERLTDVIMPGEAPHRLAKMFEPRSIALVGASEKSVWSHLIMRNYTDFDYDGRLFAVNLTGSSAHGLPGFTSCVAIGEQVDLAFIFVPQTGVIAALEDAAAAGIGNVAILTSGFSELGGEGAALQATLLDRAEALGVTLWGPNSLGFNNVSARIPVSVIPTVKPILPPSIAIVSQSGASAAELNEFAHSQNIGTSFVAATGNEGQVGLSDVIDYLVDHEPTKAIAVFAEAVRDPLTFARAAGRARAKAKPIVMLKIGRSALAGAVAQAHTGSLAGDDKVFDAVCERLGIIRVDTTEDLVNVAGLLAATGPLKAPGLGYISISGGACTLVADGAEAAGISLPPNGPETVAALRKVLPGFASTLNPLDVTGIVIRQPELFESIIPVAAAAPDIGLIAIGMTVPTMEGQGIPAALAAIGRAVATLDKPAIMVSTTNKALNALSREALSSNALPHVINGIDDMLRAVSKAVWWSQQLGRPTLPMLLNESTAPAAERPVTERATLDYLASSGVRVIPGTIAQSAEEAAAFAAVLDEPVVLKIASPDIAHKTEVGGVKLNVSPDEVAASVEMILRDVSRHRPDAIIDGVIVSPMRQGGIELLVGITRDPTWGLVLTVAFGGVLVELLTDAVLAPLPVDRSGVIAMLGRLRGAKLLQGYRGAPAADLDAVADVVVRITEAAIAFGPALEALEINPLLVRGDEVEALDALALWAS